MTCLEIATLVLSTIGGLVGGYFGAYFRKKGENLATKDDIGAITTIVEMVKADIAKQSDEFRSELNIAANRKTKLYDIRIEILKELYVKAHNLNRAYSLSGIIDFFEFDSVHFADLDSKIDKAYIEFSNFYDESSIFLPDELDNYLSNFVNKCSKYYLMLQIQSKSTDSEPNSIENYQDKQREVIAKMRWDLPFLLKELKDKLVEIIDK